MRKIIKNKTDFTLFKISLAFLTFVYLVTLLKIVLLKYLEIAYTHLSWKYSLINLFLFDFLIAFFASIFVILLTKKLMQLNYGYIKIFCVHFCISLIISLLMFGLWILINYFMGSLHKEYGINNFIIGYTASLKEAFLLYFSIVAISYSYYFLKEKEEVALQSSLLQNQLNEAKLHLLNSNLHPHFLFNTLNSISTLVEVNKKQAQNTIADLANLLRDLLNIKDKNLITIEEELYILKSYINIIKVRFSDHFKFITEIDKNLYDSKIPSMLLQPIIENSVKHGYSYNNTDLMVKLSISLEKERILILIENNGKPLKTNFNEIEKGIGLKNTTNRLQVLYKNQFSFSMKNLEENKGVVTKIIIPYLS